MNKPAYKFKDLVDIRQMQQLMDDLYAATGIPSAIITMDGEILSGSGWQRICTEFHRRHPESEQDCIASDIAIRSQIDEGEPYAIYRCPRGLVDASSPVIIEGEHVANVFAGQLFMELPDRGTEQFFREQAQRYGFDEEQYISAFREIPVLPEEKFRPMLKFLARFAVLLAGMGLTRQRELDAMAELSVSEQKYRSLIESTKAIPWEMELPSLRFTYIGPQAESAFGHPLDYFTDFEAWKTLVHPDDRERAAAFRTAEIEAGRDHELAYRALGAEGRMLWIQESVSLARSADGKLRLVGFMLDITGSRKADEERTRLEDQLRQAQKLEAIGTLAGGIAHDFNNLLFAILGYSELLRDRLEPGTPEYNQIDGVLAAATRAKGLVQQILAFSRKSEREQILLDLGSILEEAAKLLKATLPSTIEIRLKLEPVTALINADPTEIHQVIMNLCTNSAQALEGRPGMIEIGLRNFEVDENFARGNLGLKPGPHLELAVRDSGQGMVPEVMERIFEPFFTTKERGQGTGMGLAVVHGIVSKLGGAIAVDSEEGRGTCFQVYLPVSADLEPESAVKQTDLPRGTEHVLVVDDEGAILEVVSELLRGLGYKVTSCQSSMKAALLFEQTPEAFDLLLTDQTMPNLTGVELAQLLLRTKPGLPVILYSGYSEIASPDLARELGIREFIYKPPERRELAEALRRALESKAGSWGSGT